MELIDIQNAVTTLHQRQARVTLRGVQALTGGSMRDVARLLRQLGAADAPPSALDDEHALDAAHGLPDEVLGPLDDEDEVVAPPPGRPPVSSRARRTLTTEVCHLCQEPVSLETMVNSTTSLVPSCDVFQGELSARPIVQHWHLECLKIFIYQWNLAQQKEAL